MEKSWNCVFEFLWEPGLIWHHEACRVMTNSDSENLSHPHSNSGFCFLLTIRYYISILEKSFQKLLNMLRSDIT